MRVLGIETSCDETAVAVVEAPNGEKGAGRAPVGRILANVIYSQLTEHRRQQDDHEDQTTSHPDAAVALRNPEVKSPHQHGAEDQPGREKDR